MYILDDNKLGPVKQSVLYQSCKIQTEHRNFIEGTMINLKTFIRYFNIIVRITETIKIVGQLRPIKH